MTAIAVNIKDLHPDCITDFNRKRVKKAFWNALKLLKDKRIKSLLKNNIETSKNIRFGKAVISGTRIAVEDVVSLWLAGYSDKEIIRQFSKRISQEQLDVARIYYFSKKGKYQMFKYLYLGCLL